MYISVCTSSIFSLDTDKRIKRTTSSRTLNFINHHIYIYIYICVDVCCVCIETGYQNCLCVYRYLRETFYITRVYKVCAYCKHNIITSLPYVVSLAYDLYEAISFVLRSERSNNV